MPQPITFRHFIITIIVLLTACLLWQLCKEWSETTRIRYSICKEAGGTVNRSGECLPLTGRIIR